MNPSTSQLLAQGLAITVAGMGLVFAALALLWGLTRLLTKVFADKDEPAVELNMLLDEADSAEDIADARAVLEAAADLTKERARVAAMVAGALLSNALPLLFEAPTGGPAFEHGRIAPSWVTANRARTMQTWQPPRASEGSRPEGD